MDNIVMIAVPVVLVLLAVIALVIMRGRRKQQREEEQIRETEMISLTESSPVIKPVVKAPVSPVVPPVSIATHSAQAVTVSQSIPVVEQEAPAVTAEQSAVEDVQIDKTFTLNDVGWESGQEAEVSVAQVDDLTEYKVYKQFGYFDKAAKSLGGYLALQDVKPKELVFELCGMYLEAGALDDFVLSLEEYHKSFSREELEDVTKMAFELDPNNLGLRVFAEEHLGWGVKEVAENVATDEAIPETPSRKEEVVVTEDDVSKGFRADKPEQKSYAQTARGLVGKQLVRGFAKVFGVTADERNAIIAFSSLEHSVRLLGKEIPYASAVSLYNRAVIQSARPAGVLIDAMNLDVQNRHLDNYAEHLWRLYSCLGKYGRLVRERMLGWGYVLGQHPLFDELDQMPDEIRLQKIGVEFGYVSDTASSTKSKMLPLVAVEDIHQNGASGGDEVSRILQESESQLMYGQLEEAMSSLEKGVFTHMQAAQLYSALLDLYERSESWSRFEQFSLQVRSSGQDLPEEVVVMLSRLAQKAGAEVGR